MNHSHLSGPDDPFAAQRPRLVGIAYRMCGSLDDAEDVVQEAWLRWQGADRDAIESPPAWLTTVVTRLSIDRLRVLERERERYVGPWLPEPLVEPVTDDVVGALPGPGTDDPQWRSELSDSLTTTFLLMLEELSATERAALLLVEVFGETHAQAAETLQKSPEATRQLVSRARRKLRRSVPAASPPGNAAERRVAEQFVMAAVTGDHDALRALMAADVVAISDGGAGTRAARRPVVGRGRVSRYVVNLTKRATGGEILPVLVGGRPGVLVRTGGSVEMVTWFEVVDGLVRRIHSVRNPDKLRHTESHPELI